MRKKVLSETSSEIIYWLHNRPNWLQNLAKYWLSKGNVSDGDIEQATEDLKNEEAKKVTHNRDFSGLTNKASTTNKLHLISLDQIEGIENLSPSSPLNFGNNEVNLCTIYGHNGSGKSGYVRILKKMSGKPRAEELRPNVFKEDQQESQKCIITYTYNDQEQKEREWNVSDNSLLEFESIDIFDQKEANFYLKKETETSYTPFEVSLFESLVNSCEQVKNKLIDEQNNLVKKLPYLPEKYCGTKSGEKYQNLKPEDSEKSLKEFLLWTKEDQKKYDQLKERLSSKDPVKLAKEKRAKKEYLDKIISDIERASKATNEKASQSIQDHKNEAKKKRKIATEGAKSLDSTAKLEGIGTETWRALWEAAKEYSTKEAYPNKAFPATNEGDHCVLCHQELDDEAKKRLQNFENYVQGELASDAQQAEKKYREAIQQLPDIPNNEDLGRDCLASGLDAETWKPKLEAFWKEIKTITEKLRDGEPLGPTDSLSDHTNSFPNKLKDKSKKLQEEINRHKEDSENFNYKKINQEKLELEAKCWMSQQKEAIEKEIKRLQKDKQYDEWIKQTNTKSISDKSAEISRKVITQAYIERFNDELKALGACKLQVEISAKTDKGVRKHQVKLSNANSRHKPAEILSKGEKRIVALAAFLANVTGRQENMPFVFDDPVSSLDVEFERKIVERLIKLARDRQVIIFTHRLTLYGAVEEVSKKQNISLARRNIEQFDGSTGDPADEAVWMQNTAQANEKLIGDLKELKKNYDKGKQDKETYKTEINSICFEFRKLIERTIEDDLLKKVVKRHRHSITTQNRLVSLGQISEKDTEFLDRLMNKYSVYNHSQSEELSCNSSSLPEIENLRSDLEALLKWRKNFKDRAQ